MARTVAENIPKVYRKYPWDDWLDGRHWVLTQAEDFPTATVESMQILAHRTAERRGLQLRTSTSGGELHLQAFDKD